MMKEEFEEDLEPTWLAKQREDALATEKAYLKNEKSSILSSKRTPYHLNGKEVILL